MQQHSQIKWSGKALCASWFDCGKRRETDAPEYPRLFRTHDVQAVTGYTHSHAPVLLLTSQPFASRSKALRTDLAIERLPKERKLGALISPICLEYLIMMTPLLTPHKGAAA